MSKYFRIFQHLLPKSHAWRVIVDKMLRKLLEGLAPFQEAYQLFVDQIFDDIDPALTRELPRWEKQFQLSASGTESERRQALDAAWKAQGGQSPGYLQSLLQAAGFDVYVHEWWYYEGAIRFTRDPRFFLNPEGIATYVFGENEAVFGEPSAVFGSAENGSRYVLVNKGPGVSYFIPYKASCFGEPEMAFGESDFVFGETTGLRFAPKEYHIPDDPDTWPYFVYIGAEVFSHAANVSEDRRIELERMILKYFPDQLWVGMMINYI